MSRKILIDEQIYIYNTIQDNAILQQSATVLNQYQVPIDLSY